MNRVYKNIPHEVLLKPDFYLNKGAVLGQTVEQLKKLGLDKEYLTENQIFQNTNTAEFNKFICNLDYTTDLNIFNDIIKEQFFVMHIRPTAKNLDYLLEFINYCKSQMNLHCVIFTSIKNINYPYITNDLRTYASLLNYNNCLGLIGEWSGGSQLGQFCAKKIIYYYDNYLHYYFSEKILEYEQSNNNDFFLILIIIIQYNVKKILLEMRNYMISLLY